MTTLTILTAGPYTSIQDKGRTGYQALGVPEGGRLILMPHYRKLAGQPAAGNCWL